MFLIALQSVTASLSQNSNSQSQTEKNTWPDPVVDIKTLSHTADTDLAVNYCREGMSTIPRLAQRQIADAGYIVVVTPRLIYDEPGQSGQQVFVNGGTTDNVGGLFEPHKRRVLIPERAAWRNSPPRAQGHYISSIVRHELGHALDAALGRISSKADYIASYKKDLQNLSADQKITQSYYIRGVSKERSDDGTASGRGELFASTFGILCTPTPEQKQKNLLACFPNVAKFMMDLEPDLAGVEKLSGPPRSRKAGAKNTNKKESSSRKDDHNSVASEQNVEQASALLQNRSYDQAKKLLTKIIAEDDSNSKAFLLRGNANSWLGNYRDSASDYSQVIKLDPDNVDARLLRARAYGWLGKRLWQERDEAQAKRLQQKQNLLQ